MTQNNFANDSPWLASDQEFWEELDPFAKRRFYPKNYYVYYQGDHSNCFYWVKSGLVKVVIIHEGGLEKILSINGPGSLFGETAAFDGKPYFASALVIEDAEIWSVTADDLFCIFETNPKLTKEILKSLTAKIRLLALQVEDLTFFDALRRIARTLVKLAHNCGQKEPTGIKILHRLTHQELANLVGTSRVTVTNTLQYLKETGVLEQKRGQITITDIDKLQSLIM